MLWFQTPATTQKQSPAHLANCHQVRCALKSHGLPLSHTHLPAAVVNTINMLFQPDLTLFTRASTIWLKQRRMSSLWGQG